MEIHVHIHGDEVKEGRAPKRKSRSSKSARGSSSSPKSKRKGKPMTRKTQLAINRGRKKAGLKPLKFKKKGR